MLMLVFKVFSRSFAAGEVVNEWERQKMPHAAKAKA